MGHLREVCRILRLGGVYLIIEVVPESGQFHEMLNHVFISSERESTGHVDFNTFEEYEGFLRQAGFAVETVQFFPLRLDMERYLPHCQVIKQMPKAFQLAI